MRSKHAKPLAVAGGRTQGKAGGTLGVVVAGEIGGLAVHGLGDTGERRIDLGLAQLRQAGTCRTVGGEGSQALLHFAAVRLHMQGDKSLDGGAPGL